jgi:hypothetical protein
MALERSPGAADRTRRRVGAAGLIGVLGGVGALVQCGSSGQSPATDAGLSADTLTGRGDGAAVDATDASDATNTSMDGSIEGSSDAAGNACMPFAMPPPAALFGSSRRVFAHYFYPFPLSIDDQPAASDYYNTQYLTPGGEEGKWLAQGGYLRQRPLPVPLGSASTFVLDDMEREVRLAIAGGITGFTVDVLSADQAAPGSPLQNILQAAHLVDSRFEIVAMLDLSALSQADAGAEASVVESIIESVAASPASYKLPDGRLVVSSFLAEAQPPAWWTSVFQSLDAQGIHVAFVPCFLDLAANEAAFAAMAYTYGLSLWGTATPAAAAGLQTLPAQAHATGDIFMMPVLSQQYRPKDFLYWEAGNSAALRNAWTSAIAGGSDWAQIVTWSDFSESGEIEPYTDRTLSNEIGTGYYDLNAYYASWFLTGQQPVITDDVLYYFYRREPTDAAAPVQTTATTAASGEAPENDVELVAFLTAPGTLAITIDGQTSTQDAPAGMTSMKSPLQSGAPRFSLTRAGAPVIDVQGGVTAVGPAGLDSGVLDLTYWSGSASKDGPCQITVP